MSNKDEYILLFVLNFGLQASLTGKHLTSVVHCFTETRCDCHWIATAGEDGAVNLMSVQGKLFIQTLPDVL
jgi:hypothetical protein